MGWLFETHPSSKSDYVDRVLKRNFAPANPDSTCTLLDHSLRGNHLWLLVKAGDQGPFIGLFLLECHDGCWGYKDMDESMGPYYYDCPLRFLRQAPEPDNAGRDHDRSGRGWRDHVREHHAKVRQQRLNRPRVGDQVVLTAETFGAGYAGTYRVQADLGRKGLLLYPGLRLSSRHIKHVQLVGAVS
jgi:hypothetical protein